MAVCLLGETAVSSQLVPRRRSWIAGSAPAAIRPGLDDAVVLGIVGTCAFEATTKLLGVTNPIVQVLLVFGWTAPAARRLVALRHGGGPVRLNRLSHGMTAAAVSIPLFAMQSLSFPEPAGLANITPLSTAHLAGALCVMLAVLAPFLVPRRWMRPADTVRYRTAASAVASVEFYACAIGFVLLAGHPILTAAVCGCVMMRRCGGQLQPPA